MSVQIIKEYSNRTEFKVLKKFTNIIEVELAKLEKGILVVPGILLSKMNEAEFEILKTWLDCPSNQLILLPAWIEIDLRSIFKTSISIRIIKENWLFYEEIKCDYAIEGKFQEVIFSNGKSIFGANFRKDLSSGVITIITLPLLDYKLTGNHENFKERFLNCIKKNNSTDSETTQIIGEDFTLSEIHEYIIMLKAAGYELNDSLIKNIKKYFGKEIDKAEAAKHFEELKNAKFIVNETISTKGLSFIENKRFKSFIRVLKERRLKDG